MTAYEAGKPPVPTGAINVWALQKEGRISRIIWAILYSPAAVIRPMFNEQEHHG